MVSATAATAAGGAESTLSRDKDFLVDPLAFARELNSRFKNLASREEKVQASLQTLKSLYPRAVFNVDDSQRASTATKTHTTVASDKAVTVNADVLENMTTDSSLAEQVSRLLDGFLGDGWEKNLLDSREFEGKVWKSMHIQVEAVGYYESYQTSNGVTTAAVANLRMEFDYRIGQNLDKLLGLDKQNASGADASALGSNGGLLGNRSGLLGAWQFSGFFSSSAAQYFNFSGGGQNGQARSSFAGMQAQSLTTIKFQLEMQMQMASLGQFDSLTAMMGMFGLVDPLVLDLGGDGIDLRAAEEGVYFDMRGDGKMTQTGFIQGNTALLYLDANANGVADDIHELFGDSQGHANGFEELAQYDVNGDGVIDEKDPIYAELRLWRDLNGDGVNQREESMTLAEAGIAALHLDYAGGRLADGKGNLIGERSRFTRADGTSGTMADVWFKTLG